MFICHLALSVCCQLCVVYDYFRFGCHHSNAIVAITWHSSQRSWIWPCRNFHQSLLSLFIYIQETFSFSLLYEPKLLFHYISPTTFNNYLPSLSPWAPKSFSPYLHIHISYIPFTLLLLLLTLLASHDSWMIFLSHFVLYGCWYNIFLLHLHGPLHLFAPTFSLHHGLARTKLLSFNINQRGCQEQQHQGSCFSKGRQWTKFQGYGSRRNGGTQHSCSKERALSLSKQDLQRQRSWSPQWSKSHFKQVNSVVEETRSTRMNKERKSIVTNHGLWLSHYFFF